MSLWWARRDQLDLRQVDLIENLLLQQNHLVLGPPGSGKTNVCSAERSSCERSRCRVCRCLRSHVL